MDADDDDDNGDKGVRMVAINKLWIPPDIAFHGH